MDGKLVTVLGVMGSGKTERLIQDYRELVANGESVIVFKPVTDTRENQDIVKSRSGATAPALSVKDVSDIYKLEDNLHGTILIDEIQFFDQSDVVNSLLALTVMGLNVHCYGLDLTSDGITFGKVGDIMAHSDEVIKLKMKCSRCNNLARISSYNGEDKQGDVKVGDLDVYEPICRSCFYEEDIGLNLSDEDPLYYVEVVNKSEGFRMELLISKSALEAAGYTYDDVMEISTVEGANNLLEDLGMSMEDGDE